MAADFIFKVPDFDRNSGPTPRKRESAPNPLSEITRRQFVIGAVAAGGIIALSGGAFVVFNNSNVDEGSKTLSVAANQVFTIDDMELVDEVTEMLKTQKEITLNYNTLVTQSSNEVLSLLESTGAGNPVCNACTLKLSDGSKNTILTGPTIDKPRFDILDFKANENGCAWVESNVLTGENIVKSHLGTGDAKAGAKTALTCDSSQTMPHIEVCDNSLWIQTAPAETGSEKEKLFMTKLGGDEDSLEEIAESRTFATAPAWTSKGIVASPRNSYSASRFNISLFDPDTGEIADNLTLPQSMTPQDVTYGKTGFSFTFQGSYTYGDGIANIGTYVQSALGTTLAADDDAARDKRNAALSDENWLSFRREPTCPCAWIGNYVCVKSTSSIAVIDFVNKRYGLIKADDGADDYGVWMVSTGEVDRLVTLQNINYTPLNGNLVKECRLKVWSA